MTPSMADTLASTTDDEIAWSQSELKLWGQMRMKGDTEPNNLKIKHSKISQLNCGHFFKKHTKKTLLKWLLTFHSKAMNGPMYHSILIQ
jgi:hypothetical protein